MITKAPLRIKPKTFMVAHFSRVMMLRDAAQIPQNKLNKARCLAHITNGETLYPIGSINGVLKIR